MNKKCEYCGKEFTCSHNETCWCINFDVSKELAEYLKVHFMDCLCEDCLKWHIDNSDKILNTD
jgi:hypothetical protein